MFKSDDPEHQHYLPIIEWLKKPSVKLVMGGSLYRDELNKVRSILSTLAEYDRKGKICRVLNEVVDAEQARIKLIEPRADFDDPHLVAIVSITGCKLICVRDVRAHKFLRDSRFYVTKKARPKLYTRPQNDNLLCNSNLGRCCK